MENFILILESYVTDFMKSMKKLDGFYAYNDLDFDKLIYKDGRNRYVFAVGLYIFLDTAYVKLDDENYKSDIFDGIDWDHFLDYLSDEEKSFFNEKIAEGVDDEKFFLIDDLINLGLKSYNLNWEEYENWNDEDWLNDIQLQKELLIRIKLNLFNFNNFILEIFNCSPFIDFINHLAKRHCLHNFLEHISAFRMIHMKNAPEKYFETKETFTEGVIEFINELSDSTVFDILKGDFTSQVYFGETPLFHDKTPFRDEFLAELLFSNTNMNEYSKINIYDPCCDNINLIKKTFEFIKSRNDKCCVKYYGKLNFNESLFDTAKVILHSFLNQEDIFLSLSQDSVIPFEDVSLEEMDFIVSDYSKPIFHEIKSIDIINYPEINYHPEIGFLHQFQNKLNHSTKLVLILSKIEFSNNYLTFMVLNDNLEAILTFDDYFILILNSNKQEIKNNKFLLADYTLLDEEFHQKNFENFYQLSDGFFSEENLNVISSLPLKELEKKLKLRYYKYYEGIKSEYLNDILEAFANFNSTNFSKVVSNDEAVKNYCLVESRKLWGIYSFPKDILDNPDIEYEEFGGLSKLASDMDYYLQFFNFNDLIYDLKRRPYHLIKQKYIANKQSEIIEEKLDFVPLHTLITLDENEIPDDELESRKINIYDCPIDIYLKSDEILTKFLSYYLGSGKGLEEYSYFAGNFGFEFGGANAILNHEFTNSDSPHDYFTTATCPDSFYMRIPLIDIQTQEQIIKAYELNEEHYRLVKKSRDYFKNNILDYEKVLKDMEDFNRMEIDTKTGQIINMSTVKRHMFDGLLWPLSISYLNAVHGTHVSNPNEKLDFYLKLFEFLTAFIDIILISSIPDKDYDSLKETLWEGISEKHSYKASFGTWTTLYHKLLDLYGEMNIRPKFNNTLIDSLLNHDIYEIMDEAREIRNEFAAHGVSISESRAKQLIDDLKLKIDVVYDIFGYLTGFKLFYSVKVLELYDDGSNLYEVVSLNGPCDQPIYGKVTFNKRLKNNSLYLNNSVDGDLLELNKNLIKFEEVVEEYTDKKGQKKQRATGRFYLYLFNGFKNRKNKIQVKYKCYQVETDQIRKNISLEEWKEFM